MNLSYWLRKTPQPAVVMADDKRIEVPRNGRAWRDLTQTIKSLEPSKLTCLDGQGNVIRSVVLESETEEAAPATAATPEMSDLQLFARLLSEAYDKANTAQQPIVENAMAFVDRQGQHLAKAEAEIERLRAHIHKLNLQIVDLSNPPTPEAGGDDSIVGAFMGALQAAGAGAGPPTPPTPITQATAGQKGPKK